MTVADYIVAHLESIGVSHCFGLSGGLAMHLFDSLGRSAITFCAHHHEQAAVIAADAYARQTGKLGVCVVTGGPGVSNILTSVISAWQDSIPLLVIAGQVKTTAMMTSPTERQRGTFEIAPIPIFQSVTKYCGTMMNAYYAQTMLSAGIDHALSNRPGPVLLEVPLDVQGAEYV